MFHEMTKKKGKKNETKGETKSLHLNNLYMYLSLSLQPSILHCPF